MRTEETIDDRRPTTKDNHTATIKSKIQNPKSKILFDGRYIQDRYHGIGRYAFHLASELATALPGRHFEVLRDPSLRESRFDWGGLTTHANVTLHEVAAPPFSLAEQLRLLPKLAHPAQVYHTPYFAIPWLSRARSLVTVHDCIFERDPRYMPRRWARSYYRLLMMVSARRAYAVFVPSRATASDVRRFYRVPARKLVVTPEAADTAFRPIHDKDRLDEARQRYNLHGPFMLAVGMRRPHKNFAMLVRAFEQATGAYDGALVPTEEHPRLVFIGEADERFPDEAAAARSMGDRVRFLGKVPEADLPMLYNLATAFACPSLIEGFGLPVLEAMSCGTPVICSDIPVLREVAGGAALYVPPTDPNAWAGAIQNIFSHPETPTALSQAGLARSGQFTWQRCAQSVLPIYRRLGLG